MSWSLIYGVLPIVNRIDQETEKEARAVKPFKKNKKKWRS
jgi:hypothetical protein